MREVISDLDPCKRVEAIDRICDAFEAEWQSGKTPDLATFLGQLPNSESQEQLFYELLILEVAYRSSREQAVPWPEYEQRFPNFLQQIEIVAKQHAEQKRLVETTRMVQGGSSDTPDATIATPTSSSSRGASDLPSKIGSYVILNKIAEHGQGVVYRANHPTLHRQAVIKVSNAQMESAHPQGLEDEATVLAKLNHPNVATVYDLQTDSTGRRYIVMEYIEGRNLADLMKERQFSHDEAVKLLVPICRGLQHAHELGILHLDLKPANIVVRASDKVPKIIDFGLAQLRSAYGESSASNYGGTLKYMAPEQAQQMLDVKTKGRSEIELDVRADIFALGCIFFEMAGGESFRPTTALKIEQVLSESVDRFSHSKLPTKVESLCRHALAANPAARLRSAEDFAQRLQELDGRLASVGANRFSVSLSGCGLTLVIMASLLMMISYRWDSARHWFRDTMQQGAGSADWKVAANGPSPVRPDAVVAVPSNEAVEIERFDVLVSRNKTAFEPIAQMVPLQTGDHIRFSIQLSKPAHMRLFWIDVEGNPEELYPLDPEIGDRGSEAVASFESPEQLDRGWPLNGPEGIEAAVLLVNQTPIVSVPANSLKISPNAKDSRPPLLLARYQAARSLTAIREDVGQSPNQTRSLGHETEQVNDPVLKLLETLKQQTDIIRAVAVLHQNTSE